MKKQNLLTAMFFGAALLGFASVSSAQISDEQFGKMMEKYLSSDAGKNAVGGAMEQYAQKRQQEAQKQAAEKEAAQLEDQFKNPVKIDVGSAPVKGPKDAKITIIEFSDFQCPFCKRGTDTMTEVMKAYPNDVKLAFKHFPLPFHPQAMPAAKAAYAAGKQGKFWEMHDALFSNQGQLGTPEFLTKQAEALKLNVAQFKKDMEDPATEKSIKDDMEAGQKNGIQGTPGFFVNGVAVKGAYPVDHFKKIIDRWLAGNKPEAAKAGTQKS